MPVMYMCIVNMCVVDFMHSCAFLIAGTSLDTLILIIKVALPPLLKSMLL